MCHAGHRRVAVTEVHRAVTVRVRPVGLAGVRGDDHAGGVPCGRDPQSLTARFGQTVVVVRAVQNWAVICKFQVLKMPARTVGAVQAMCPECLQERGAELRTCQRRPPATSGI